MWGLKSKKTIAWIVMLTFLFTCIMPSNIMAGNSIAEAAEPQPVTATGVTVKLFNYDQRINSQGLGTKGYKFFHSGAGTAEDGAASSGTYHGQTMPEMKMTLTADGYPNTAIGSMAYLFNTPAATLLGGGGLFQKDANGYYYYDSGINAASYANGRFTLYDYVVRPSYITSDLTDVRIGNFLPFNNAESVTRDRRNESDTANGSAVLNGLVDLWFGMSADFEFYMPKDGKMNGQNMVFNFHGDDDVFVYLDGVLILDIGGTHAAYSGKINFATGAVQVLNDTGGVVYNSTIKDRFVAAGRDVSTGFNGNTFADYTLHDFDFFYMERGGNISYCQLKYNMPVLPENSLTVEKELTADPTTPGELQEVLEQSINYQFRVLDTDGNVLLANDEFTIKNINDEIIGTDVVGSDGIFELKSGQRALFTDMIEKTGQKNYIVQEIIQDNLTGQYNNIAYQVNGAGGITQTDHKAPVGFTGYNTDTLEFDKAQFVRYTNQVDTEELSALQITKTIKDASTSSFDINREFEMQVKFGGELYRMAPSTV